MTEGVNPLSRIFFVYFEIPAMQTLTIYHHPRCSKSRLCLQRLRDRGLEPQVVAYLETPPDRAMLQSLWQRLGESMVRWNEPLAKELGLRQGTSEQVLAALEAHPQLLERPIVVWGERALVARPPEKVDELWGSGDD